MLKVVLDDVSLSDISFGVTDSYLDRKMLHGNAETLVLRLLSEGPMHGYRIRQELAKRSRDVFQLSFGCLYPLFDAMESRHMVTSEMVKGRGDQERRMYSITKNGRSELEDRLFVWQRFRDSMNRVLRS